MNFVYSDGGRHAAGFRGLAGDCVCRAISIACQLDYADVYRELADRNAALGRKRSAREGTSRRVYEAFLADLGWAWQPTMTIGSGCQVHLRDDELPGGRLIVRVTRHLCAVIDGVIHDTGDPSRGGTRCVYGYFHQ